MRTAALSTTLWAAGAQPLLAQTGTVTVALTSDVPTMDASQDSSPVGQNLRINLFDQLTETKADGTLGPRLATSWDSSPDATTWTFTLRGGARFQDGSTITADDIVWNFEKILADHRTPVRTYLSKLQSVENLGDNRIRFHLNEPFAIFDRQVGLISILPRRAYEAMGAEKFGQLPIGSGPYRLTRWIRDDRIELAAFDDYWRGAPKIKTVILRPIPSEAGRVSALLSGEVDIVPSLPPAFIDRLKSRSGIRVGTAPGYRVMFLGFNVTTAPLDNVNFRLAVDCAIDRVALTKKLLRGLGTPAGEIVPPVDFGYDPKIAATAYDPAKARALLQQSGYHGQKLVFQYASNTFPLADEVAQAIAGYLGEVGITVGLQATEYNTFFPAWANRKLPGMYLFAYGSSLYDADSAMAGLYESGSRIYAVDPQIDNLAREARAQSDPTKRKAVFSQIFTISKQTAAYVMLYNDVQAFAVRSDLDWVPRPDGLIRPYDIGNSEK
jgi:peptide/nickel transport system substrate-binding protein